MRHSNDESGSAKHAMDGDAQTATGQFVLDASHICMPMIFTDARMRGNPIVFANERFLELTGYSGSEVIGRRIRDLLKPPISTMRGPSILTALELGNEGCWELRCLGSNREYFATVFNCPVHDEAGNLIQNALTFVKIDGHLNRLVEEHNEFHEIFQQAPGFIAIAEGPNHRISFANISYKRFVGRMDLEGLTVAEAFPELVLQGFIALLDEVFVTGEPYIAQNIALEFVNLATGIPEQKFANFVYQPIRAANGTVTGIFCEGYDITAQHRAADDLAAIQAEMIQVSRLNAMGTMAITLAHELNQPLAAIVNYAEGAKRFVNPQEVEAPALTDALTEISGAALRAGELLRNLRDLTTGRATRNSHFNLKNACSECIRLAAIVAHPAVDFIDEIPAGIAVNSDRIQVQQVVLNLLRNASEAVHFSVDRTVTISAIEEESSIIVCVADRGPGVSVDAAQALFTFSESAKKGGMGIGLSICRTIVESQGGRIWLERSDESGTEMRFSLPYSAAVSTSAIH